MEVIKKMQTASSWILSFNTVKEVKKSSLTEHWFNLSPTTIFFSFRILLVMIQCIHYKELYLFILKCYGVLKYLTIFRINVEGKVQMYNYSCSRDLNLEFHDKAVPVTLSTASMSLS